MDVIPQFRCLLSSTVFSYVAAMPYMHIMRGCVFASVMPVTFFLFMILHLFDLCPTVFVFVAVVPHIRITPCCGFAFVMPLAAINYRSIMKIVSLCLLNLNVFLRLMMEGVWLHR